MNIEEEKMKRPFRPEASGWCALVLASFFALLALMFIWGALFPPTHPDAASVFLPFLSFFVGNVFAFVSLASRSAPNQRAGKLALRILWVSLGLLVIIGFTAERRHASTQIEQTLHE